jgi:hypothetical protein
MGYYEPQWSAEEQTMVDLMKLAGYGVVPDINEEDTIIHLINPNGKSLYFRDCTEYGAIRKCFNAWTTHHAQVI